MAWFQKGGCPEKVTYRISKRVILSTVYSRTNAFFVTLALAHDDKLDSDPLCLLAFGHGTNFSSYV